MKNIFRILMAVAVLFTASCAKEDISSSIGGGEVEVTFTANFPELGTRTEYGTGAKVNTLRYYVYDSEGNALDGLNTNNTITAADGTKHFTVNLVLIKGMTYNILFWADSNSGHYSVGDNGIISVVNTDEHKINANDESRDAFYAAVKGFNPANATAENTKIDLYRPFAQLNAKVTNMDEVNKSIKVESTTISTKIYTTFNPFAENENEVVGGLTDEPVTFTETKMDDADIAAGHLSMNYLLAPADGCVADVAFTFNNNKGVAITGTTYTSVPLKANYRTNIIGALLTNSTDFTVEIEAGFNEPAEDYQVVTVNVPSNNTEDIVISVGTTQVTVPAAAAQAGDKYKVVVSNENTATDSATGATTVAFDLTLYKNDVKVSGDVVYAVTKNIGAGLFISEVTHNGTAMTNATTGADQTYTYDAATGVLTIYTKTFSPFAVTYKTDPAENFADNSWEDIIRVCQNNAVPSSWNVGDKKTMTIGDSSYNIAIIGKNHDSYSDGSGKAPLTLQPTEVCGSAAMNATPTNATGWSASQMRTVTMVEILSAIPSEVQNAIKAVDKLTLKGDGSGLETTSDKLFLLSLYECYGSTFYSNGYEEGSKYAYYSNEDNRIMNATWWLRGPGINNGKNNGIGFTQINMSGLMANGDASYASGVIFGFCF